MAKTAADELMLPASAYAELLVRPFRSNGGRVRTVEDAIASVPLEIIPITREVARAAARLRADDDALTLSDAFVLASAEAHDASLLTADRRLARRRNVRAV